MGVTWGVVILVLGLLAWGGQAVSWLAPGVAARWGLTETEASVEPAFWADVRGEALWDTLTLWTLPSAGLGLIFNVSWWPYLGMTGGAVYAYFGGRGIVARLEMGRRGLRAGTRPELGAAYVMLPLWGIVGLATAVAAIRALPA